MGCGVSKGHHRPRGGPCDVLEEQSSRNTEERGEERGEEQQRERPSPPSADKVASRNRVPSPQLDGPSRPRSTTGVEREVMMALRRIAGDLHEKGSTDSVNALELLCATRTNSITSARQGSNIIPAMAIIHPDKRRATSSSLLIPSSKVNVKDELETNFVKGAMDAQSSAQPKKTRGSSFKFPSLSIGALSRHGK